MWSAVCNGDRQYYTYCSIPNTTACRAIYGRAYPTLCINIGLILATNIGLDIGKINYNHNDTTTLMMMETVKKYEKLHPGSNKAKLIAEVSELKLNISSLAGQHFISEIAVPRLYKQTVDSFGDI